MFFGYFPNLLEKTINYMKESILFNLITVMIIATSFFIFAGFLMLVTNLGGILQKVEDKIQIDVYLENGLSEEEIAHLEQMLSQLPQVELVRFISKENALKNLKNNFQGKENLFEELQTNPLPSSFEIRLERNHRKFQQVEHLVKKISHLKGVDEVGYGQEWVERFSYFFRTIKLTGIILGGLLLLTVTFIISNTIRLTIHARQEEIEIMKLVGATDSFIKLPFIIEGGIQGLSGTLLSLGALFLCHRFFISKAALFFGITNDLFVVKYLSPEVIGAIVTGGIFLGIFGSLISIERFLRT